MDFTQAIEKHTKWYEDNYSLPRRNAEDKAFEDLCAFYLKTRGLGERAKVSRSGRGPILQTLLD